MSDDDTSQDAAGGKRVLILGGGVGGLSVAAALRPQLRDEDTVTVVDRTGSHVQGLSLLWILRGWRGAGARGSAGEDLVQALVALAHAALHAAGDEGVTALERVDQ